MQTQPLETDIEITSALTVEELEQVKANGFKTVICNCKPGESAEFPDEDAYRKKPRILAFSGCIFPSHPVTTAKQM